MEKDLEKLQLAIEKTGLSLALNQDDMVTGRLNEILEMLESFPRESKFIPQNMIDGIDQGINPEVIQKQQLQTLIDKNQKTNGKLKSLKYFRDELLVQIKLNYPNLDTTDLI